MRSARVLESTGPGKCRLATTVELTEFEGSWSAKLTESTGHEDCRLATTVELTSNFKDVGPSFTTDIPDRD